MILYAHKMFQSYGKTKRPGCFQSGYGITQIYAGVPDQYGSGFAHVYEGIPDQYGNGFGSTISRVFQNSIVKPIFRRSGVSLVKHTLGNAAGSVAKALTSKTAAKIAKVGVQAVASGLADAAINKILAPPPQSAQTDMAQVVQQHSALIPLTHDEADQVTEGAQVGKGKRKRSKKVYKKATRGKLSHTHRNF